MTENQNTKCSAIIHTASAAAAAAGALPVPGPDAVPIMAAQVTMIVALGEVFDVHFTRSYAEALVKNKIAEEAGKFVLGQAAKFLPGGSLLNATIAASVTEALGWEVADEFSKRAC